ncbi:MAG: DUF4160 domain-containing protein [Nitrospinae bacterium]|nr:DUF4160 domain-containing protein [Nitrospinota bacterium]
MPTISVFFGIIIRMYHREHAPPHFHAFYSGEHAIIDIGTLQVKEGRLPRRALDMVLEWASIHRRELMMNWNLAQERKPLLKIEALE